MQLTDLENENVNDEAFPRNNSWDPNQEGPVEGDWDDEDDEDFEDEDFEDRAQDLDDLHEIQMDDDLAEPDPNDDDHFPEEDE
jgi:hypothetical protein